MKREGKKIFKERRETDQDEKFYYVTVPRSFKSSMNFDLTGNISIGAAMTMVETERDDDDNNKAIHRLSTAAAHGRNWCDSAVRALIENQLQKLVKGDD